ncbi:uncharacterized protein TNCV_3756741 [Trichonephila clavipes]|nr:uncharacterized protein TNCV_3756741 [Trichonephila clavipes]
MAWVHTGSPTRPRKASQILSARKLMVTAIWDAQGILLIEFMTHGTTINFEVYCRTLKKLKRAIQIKRSGLQGLCFSAITCALTLLLEHERFCANSQMGCVSTFSPQPKLGSY